MLGVVIHLPTFVANYVATTPVSVIAAQAFVAVGWIPIFAVVVWGMVQVWQDYKQGKYEDAIKWVLLEVHVPQDAIQTPKGMENFFMNLVGTKSGLRWKEIWLVGKRQAWFSFEIVSDEGRIRFFVRTADKYQDLIEAAFYAQYPEAQIIAVDDYVDQIPRMYPDDDWQVFGSEMTFTKKEQFLPIRTYESYEHQGEKDQRFKDPILPMIEFLGKMRPGEHLWIQYVIQMPDSQDWAKEGIKYLMKAMGKEEKKKVSMGAQLMETFSSLPLEVVKNVTGTDLSSEPKKEEKKDDFRIFKLTPHEKETLDQIAMKVSYPAFRTKIRWVYAAKKNTFRKGLVASAGKGMFAAFSHQYLNGLGMHGKMTPKDDYFYEAWQMPGRQRKLVRGFRLRKMSLGSTPVMMTPPELAMLWHFPAADARTPVLAQSGARRAEAPTELTFAPDGSDELPNWKRAEELSAQKAGKGRAEEMTEPVLPSPLAPTAPRRAPSAPLQDDGGDVPPNLPV